jgi:hypothetical protein
MRALRATLALWCLAACGDSSSPAPPRLSPERPSPSGAATFFRECARERGLDFRHRDAPQRRHHFPEIMGAGLALLDFDSDGDLDVFCVQSGDLLDPSGSPGDRLFENDGQGRAFAMSPSAPVCASMPTAWESRPATTTRMATSTCT